MKPFTSVLATILTDIIEKEEQELTTEGGQGKWLRFVIFVVILIMDGAHRIAFLLPNLEIEIIIFIIFVIMLVFIMIRGGYVQNTRCIHESNTLE